jgi:hypothetical protein
VESTTRDSIPNFGEETPISREFRGLEPVQKTVELAWKVLCVRFGLGLGIGAGFVDR